MAVMVTLQYLGLGSSANKYKFKYIFQNGGPGKYPSWNYEGNYMDIYGNNQRLWRYGSPVTFTTSQYLYPNSSWTQTVELTLNERTGYTLYGKTQDLKGEYPQYLATSNSISVPTAGMSAISAGASSKSGVNVFVAVRYPQGQDLCYVKQDGNKTHWDIGASNTDQTKAFSVSLKPNSAYNLQAGLSLPGTNTWACGTKSIRIATTFTDQARPSFTVTRDSSDSSKIKISWAARSESNYPSGNGVSRADRIEVYAANGTTLLKTFSGLDFRNAGSVTYTSVDAVIIKGLITVTGLWNEKCKPTTYTQNVFSSGIATAINVFCKSDKKTYKQAKSVHVKTDSKTYKPIKKGYIKIASNRYIQWF